MSREIWYFWRLVVLWGSPARGWRSFSSLSCEEQLELANLLKVMLAANSFARAGWESCGYTYYESLAWLCQIITDLENSCLVGGKT